MSGLTPKQLIARLRAVRHSGDRASMFVYLQAARLRARGGNLGGSEAAGFELAAARSRIRGADEVRTIAYLSRHETNSLYNPDLAVPGR